MKRIVWRVSPLEVGSLFRMPDPGEEDLPEERVFVVERCHRWPSNSRGEIGYSVDLRPLDDAEKMAFRIMET